MDIRRRGIEKRKKKYAIYSRLGVKRLNKGRKCIRFAPRYGTKFEPDQLQSKIADFENWIKKTIADVPQGTFSQLMEVSVELEQPRNGDPSFEIAKAKFAEDKNLWDLKQLLIGAKEFELPGFPVELENLRSKMHISRDTMSDRERRLGLQTEGDL